MKQDARPELSEKPPWSLAARLTAWYALSSFALLLIVSGFLYWALSSYLDEEDDEFLQTKIRVVERILQEKGEASHELRNEVAVQWAAHEYRRVYARLLDAGGNVIVSSPHMAERVPPEICPVPGSRESRIGEGAYIRPLAGEVYRAMTARIREHPGKPFRVLQIAVNETAEFKLLAQYRRRMWVVLGIAFLACAVVGYEIARRGIRPVREIAFAAQRIRSTTLHERICPTGLPREIATLANTFNEMLDRLEGAFSRLSAFSADIAHELRTPINSLRGEIEVALSRPRTIEEYRQVLSSSLEECVRVTRLIESLLFLARAENPRTMVTKQPLEIGSELSAIREFYDAAATDAGLNLQLELKGSTNAQADLDRALFQRAVGNLIENALAHTPAGGSVTVSATEENGAVQVAVRDNGAGIPVEHLPRIFDRFHRVDQARSRNTGGMGLGLSIARSIALLHGGAIDVSSELGAGTRITLTFPKSAAGQHHGA
jgi:two-component system heavy metal sensor histidine kinase CusS